MHQRLKGLIADSRGATAVEYGLILALMALAILGSMSMVAGETISMWNYVTSTVTSAIDG